MSKAVTKPRILNTPILFLVFNRPGVTARVFDAIRHARPQRLYVAADGPREDREGEAELAAKVRDIATAVDWPCEISTLFRERNLGCKRAVSGAINWFFEHEEQGIILEDDCLPNSDFFIFCETLLNRYAEDERIAVVTGDNFQNGRQRGDASYYFSKFNHCWGWATWRRAWRQYQGDMPFWPEWSASVAWIRHTPDKIERRYWENVFERVCAGQIDSWAYPWTGSVWYHGGLTATPNVNLVSNIGFGVDCTHTADENSPQANMGTSMLGPLSHPCLIEQDKQADHFVFEYTLGGQHHRWKSKLFRLLRRIFGSVWRKIKGSSA